jgi:hypothetical protein
VLLRELVERAQTETTDGQFGARARAGGGGGGMQAAALAALAVRLHRYAARCCGSLRLGCPSRNNRLSEPSLVPREDVSESRGSGQPQSRAAVDRNRQRVGAAAPPPPRPHRSICGCRHRDMSRVADLSPVPLGHSGRPSAARDGDAAARRMNLTNQIETLAEESSRIDQMLGPRTRLLHK